MAPPVPSFGVFTNDWHTLGRLCLFVTCSKILWWLIKRRRPPLAQGCRLVDFLGSASQQALQHAGHIAERIALDGFHNVMMASSQSGGLKSYSWASKWKWQVHQYANKIAVFQNSDWNEDEKTDKLRRDKLQALDDGTVEADSDPNQTGDNSYKHAMSNGDKKQSVREARDKADKYVREKFSTAINLLNAGSLYEAYRTFALGLHTLQDATSPAHHGFQPWSDHPGWQRVYNHISQEFMYPGQGSYLQMITNKYLNWFENPNRAPLPTENLFLNIQSDYSNVIKLNF